MEKTDKMPKAVNFQEHYTEYARATPVPNNHSMVSIQFMVTTPVPVIKNRLDTDDSSEVKVEVGMSTELQHSCSIYFPVSRVASLIEQLKKIEAATKSD
ncbi:hypothetical protein [uncultured Pantoea sp.]|uniref:hypothetical protein n=1 Tax=uncultured Pantoea sp. TaxID=218084 RepID=UPI00206E1F8B|nr:hypothetical protein [uncultured Pantoea sp.]DAL09278.1 MAG TPA_asm: hypothetical protein [Caudoviricetes sp.]